jgi:4-hydroxy-tetrahydrodipicolinate synthase
MSAFAALRLQAGVDGFLAIEKHILMKRGIFENTIQLLPTGWQLDPETQAEVDRLFERLQSVIHTDAGAALVPAAESAASWSDGIIG